FDIAQKIDERDLIGLRARERAHDEVEISCSKPRPTIRPDHRDFIMRDRCADGKPDISELIRKPGNQENEFCSSNQELKNRVIDDLVATIWAVAIREVAESRSGELRMNQEARKIKRRIRTSYIPAFLILILLDSSFPNFY